MTTTVESNMLNMHQSPLVLGWGQNAINASFPINAKRLQIVYPSSGNFTGANPWRPNTNVEIKQLLDKNSAMSLHGSYLNITYSVGRTQNWLPLAKNSQPVQSITQLQPLDLMDRFLLYTHWNPCRLIQNATLWIGSTNVENVNNVPLVTDAKYPFYSPEAVRTTMSDCFVQPADGQTSMNGAPLIHPIGNNALTSGATNSTGPQSITRTLCQFQDSSMSCWNSYSLMNNEYVVSGTNSNPLYPNQAPPVNPPGGGPAGAAGSVAPEKQAGPWRANDILVTEPVEYFLRNAVYACPVGASYTAWQTSMWNTDASTDGATGHLFYNFPSMWAVPPQGPASNANIGAISYFAYSYGNSANGNTTTIQPVGGTGPGAGGLFNTIQPVGNADNTAENLAFNLQSGLTYVTRRIPLSELFGFAEQNVLIPSNLVQINLTRAADEQFITNLFYPSIGPAASAADITNLGQGVPVQPRQYGIVVSGMYLVMKYYDLNQTAADLLSQDQLLTVNHYSVYSNDIPAKSAQSGSFSLQTYAGLKSLLIRCSPSFAAIGASTPVGQTGNISVIYRGKQSPLQLQQWNFVLNPIQPLAAPNGTDALQTGPQSNVYRGGPMIRCDPSTYFEEYSSWNGNCWNGISAALAPGAGHNLGTWAKSQFTVPFNFVEDQSQNADTVSAPIQLNYSFGVPMYQIDPTAGGVNGQGQGIVALPTDLRENAKYSINVVFLRTNILKYLGQSRQLVFVTNGSS